MRQVKCGRHPGWRQGGQGHQSTTPPLPDRAPTWTLGLTRPGGTVTTRESGWEDEVRGTPKGRRGAMPLLALDTGEQGRQYSLDLHGGAGAHDRLPLVLEQLRHILGWRKGAETLVRPQGRDSAPPQEPSCRVLSSVLQTTAEEGSGHWGLTGWAGVSGSRQGSGVPLCPSEPPSRTMANHRILQHFALLKVPSFAMLPDTHNPPGRR